MKTKTIYILRALLARSSSRTSWLKKINLVLFSVAATCSTAYAHYVPSGNIRLFIDPPTPIVDGYQNGDLIDIIMEVTPLDNGELVGHGAWSTFYVPAGAEVCDAKFVRPAAGGYIETPAEALADAAAGWGSRGDVNYGAGLGEGRINQVQQDSGIWYSTDPRTAFQPGTDADNDGVLDGLAFRSPTGINDLGGPFDPTPVYNQWDLDQIDAFGVNNAISGNDGAGNTPIVLGSPNQGTGSPVAGPDTFYQYDFDQSRGGNLANQLTGVGPWQRIETLGQTIAGSGAVQPATDDGFPNTNDSVPFVGGWQFQPSCANPLPSSTNAIRAAHGKRVVGDLERWSVTLRLTDAAAYVSQIQAGQVCAESIPGDAADPGASDDPKDNLWRYYQTSQTCSSRDSEAILIKKIIDPSDETAVSASQVVTYEFTLYNTGPSLLSNVVVSDAEIQNLALVGQNTAGCSAPTYNGSISSGGTVGYNGIAGGVATWASFNLPVGESATFQICGAVSGGFGDLVVNQARADYTGCGDTPCLISNATVPVTNRIAGTVYADIDGSGTFTVGEEGISGVEISLYEDTNNNGVFDAGVDTLSRTTLTSSDGSYEFSVVPSGDYIITETNLVDYISTGDIDNTTLNCGIGNGCDTIGAGGNGLASAIQVTDATNLVNQDFFDRPPFPDVSIVKTASPASVRSGDTLVYTLVATNSSNSVVPAADVVINDPLPNGLTWVSTLNSNGGGTCTITSLSSCNCSDPGNTNVIVCQMGTISIGSSESLIITTVVD